MPTSRPPQREPTSRFRPAQNALLMEKAPFGRTQTGGHARMPAQQVLTRTVILNALTLPRKYAFLVHSASPPPPCAASCAFAWPTCGGANTATAREDRAPSVSSNPSPVRAATTHTAASWALEEAARLVSKARTDRYAAHLQERRRHAVHEERLLAWQRLHRVAELDDLVAVDAAHPRVDVPGGGGGQRAAWCWSSGERKRIATHRSLEHIAWLPKPSPFEVSFTPTRKGPPTPPHPTPLRHHAAQCPICPSPAPPLLPHLSSASLTCPPSSLRA